MRQYSSKETHTQLKTAGAKNGLKVRPPSYGLSFVDSQPKQLKAGNVVQRVVLKEHGTVAGKDYTDSNGTKIFDYFKKKIQDVRVASMGEKSKKRNVGVAGIVGGTGNRAYKEFSAVSGEGQYKKNLGLLDSPADDERFFTHKNVMGHTSKHDAENKLLERIARELGGRKGEVFPDVKETVYLASEIAYCASCRELIPQFKAMFPNSTMIFVNDTRK